MNGVRLMPGFNGLAVPPQAPTTFSYLFRALADDLRPLYWYADGYNSTPFYMMTVAEEGQDDWFAQALVPLAADGDEQQANSALLFRPGTLPDAAGYLYDDWIDLIGIAGDERRAMAVASDLCNAFGQAKREQYIRLVEREAVCHFHCVDGRWWELYARDDEWLSRVVQHVADNPTVHVANLTLRGRLDEP